MLDANVIIKLVLNEPDSKVARNTVEGFLEKGHLLYTVDNALAECLNVLWKHATLLRDLSVGDTKTAIHYLLLMFNRLNVTKTPDIAEQTMAIAQTLKVPVYDALYIALAEKEKGTLYTTDKKLATIAGTIITVKLLKPN
ncbi:MAG TPA: type II toxin-antitoxin system VapC family toxin [Candidatus Deferrimicrobiaceae bacterium]|nr:type II toxin-antitoxin system VapC family toxin [Candidatus Deferrimicrobiaceae bacterium]